MKKVYQLIASASLSLLTIGAFAQTPAAKKGTFTPKAVSATDRFVGGTTHAAKKVTSGGANALIDYLAGDVANTGATFYHWASPVLTLNAAYTIADSGASYNFASNSATVTFDTIFDLYTNSFVTPVVSGSVSVDTIFANIQYHNTSGKNDTIIFNICAVNANGFITGTIYGTDTAVITPSTFTYNTLDSTQFLKVIKKTAIPSTARHGYNFAINMTVKGSKADTIAPAYYSQGTNNCAALGGYYTPAATTVGVADGKVRNVNSFATGLWNQNSKGNHGTNVSMTWPLTTGANAGMCINGGGYYSSPLPLVAVGFTACTGDTNYWAVQDIGIFPAISYTPAGINSLLANGLSVGQNYPNPFNKATQITYSLEKASDVTFAIYDMTGRVLVKNNFNTVAPGKHEINISANQFTPGVYFYSFDVNGTSVTKKMIVTQ